MRRACCLRRPPPRSVAAADLQLASRLPTRSSDRSRRRRRRSARRAAAQPGPVALIVDTVVVGRRRADRCVERGVELVACAIPSSEDPRRRRRAVHCGRAGLSPPARHAAQRVGPPRAHAAHARRSIPTTLMRRRRRRRRRGEAARWGARERRPRPPRPPQSPGARAPAAQPPTCSASKPAGRSRRSPAAVATNRRAARAARRRATPIPRAAASPWSYPARCPARPSEVRAPRSKNCSAPVPGARLPARRRCEQSLRCTLMRSAVLREGAVEYVCALLSRARLRAHRAPGTRRGGRRCARSTTCDGCRSRPEATTPASTGLARTK